ncbi:hypothetical protein [uncultured Friedmanniella sp.]|uniref:hypothetical protein n=1 Tax=uncultured Friedmanniella sp. TaxID=335381 RepID=UPI0035CBB25A
MAAVRISDQRASGRVEAAWVLFGLTDLVTVRDLIRSRVREEVARFNLSERTTFSGLVQPTETEAVANGYRLTRSRALDWERQADIAEQAFMANGFFMLVDGVQVEELDHLIDLRTDPEVGFIRLVPLVGG